MEKTLRDILSKAVASLNADSAAVDIEIPKDEGLGDLSTPIAMGLAKTLKKAPRKIAEDIINAVESRKIFEKIEIAGPGFINFTFSRAFLCRELKRLISEKEFSFKDDIGKGKRVQIEFVSANPTGPMHLGHGRGAALGAALANLLTEVGYEVQKEFYINDAGRQVKLLGLSVFVKYKQLLGLDVPLPDDGYKGDYIEDIAVELREKYTDTFINNDFDDVSAIVINFAYLRMLALIRKDLEDFGVIFDTWQSERALYEKNEVVSAIEDLKERGCVFEEGGAVWFRSTKFGDDKDRVLIKNDGDYTYFTPDIAYHRDKIRRGFDEIIDIWGADHHGYIPRMQAVIQALGYAKDHLRVLLVQMVSLLKGGLPVQMSKRAGEFITLREVMDDIGADTTKFLFLTRRSDSQLEVDIEVAKAQSSENPVYYVQYAHARINSIFEKAKEEAWVTGHGSWEKLNCDLFNDEEMRIIKKLLLYPMMLKSAATAHEPHRITFYLQELAGMFHPYYHRNKVISEDMELSGARLALCEGIRLVLKHGLKILGVKAPERM
jgi:arginyl-tRNA synthetase